MKKEFIDRLCCPMCKGNLILHDDEWKEGELCNGLLHCEKCATDYPVKDGIPILLPPELSKAHKSEATYQ